MFGVKYSRTKFWIWSIVLLIPASLLVTLTRATSMDPEIFKLNLIFRGLGLIVAMVWINVLANRIRDYGSNPWISMFSLIPLVNIGLALYYGSIQYIKKSEDNQKPIDTQNSPLVKKVLNHDKEVVCEMKSATEKFKKAR